MKNIKDLIELIDELIAYEKEQGITFDKNDLPIFKPEMFSKSEPKEIVPYDHRNAAQNHLETSICFYAHDKLLYRRLTKAKLLKLGEELTGYNSFVGFDLSIFSDFLFPVQKFYALANLVIDMFLVLKGNLLIPNLRSDESGGFYFYLFKEAPIVCCGTLGNSKLKKLRKLNVSELYRYSLNNKNQRLLLYGKKLIKGRNVTAYDSFNKKRGDANE